MAQNNKPEKNFINSLALLPQMGISVSACLLTGVLLGKYLDRTFGSTPWLLLICSILGVAAAFKSLYDFAAKMR